MDDLQATLQSLLNNPAELEQLAQTANSLLGGGGSEEKAPEIPNIQTMLQSLGKDAGGDTQKLLNALRPFLSEQRRARLERASKIAKLSSLAEFAFGSDSADG